MTQPSLPITIHSMRHGLFTFGKALLVLAFIATISELSARMMTPGISGLPSTAEVWNVFAPSSYQAFIAHHSSGFWPKFLSLPTVAIFGIPGLLLIIVFRDKDNDTDSELEASLFLFDELAKRAKEEDLTNGTFEENNLDSLNPDDPHAVKNNDSPNRDFLLDQNR